jgi:hypothetical protein
VSILACENGKEWPWQYSGAVGSRSNFHAHDNLNDTSLTSPVHSSHLD